MPILGSVVKRALAVRKKIRLKRGDPFRYQLKTLQKLLRNAQDTAFGLEHDYDGILHSADPFDEFRKRVPLTSYQNMYERWWSRIMEKEEDVTWPGKVKFFALSSGTSESSTKYIPVTKDMTRAITRASVKQFYSMANFNLPTGTFEKGIFTLGSTTNLVRKGDYFLGDMSGIQAGNSIPFWVTRFFKPGKKISGVRDWDIRLDEIARHAADWDIGVLCGIPSWVQLMTQRILEYNKAKTIHEVWPNLRVYIHGGIAFDPYRKNFEDLFGSDMTYIETYMASEGFFAFRAIPGVRGMHPILNNGILFEFVPFNHTHFDDNGNLRHSASALNIAEVETGVDYAVIISSCAGAWRYLLGDTVQFVNTDTYELIITGRTQHFLNICGEHLSLDNMSRAIHLTSEALGISIPEFTVGGIPFEGLFAHRWYIGTDDEPDIEPLRAILDNHLGKLNDDYATERDNVLKDIQVQIIPTKWFYDFMKKHGKIGDQAKFPRVLKDERFRIWTDYVANRRQLG